MIIWGGYNTTTARDTDTGGRFNPATNSWTATPTAGAPQMRDSQATVWTGTKMVIWGGGNENFVPKGTGGRYDPATNTWQATTATGAPAARVFHSAVWSGSRMIVWGGWNGTQDVDTGALYDPAADSWTATAGTGAPTARDAHTAVWTGSRMVVWGGEDTNEVVLNSGARFDPVANSWSPTSMTGAPTARWVHTAVWSGSRMIVWGGADHNGNFNTGGLYDPAANTWTPTSVTGAPKARRLHAAVWAGSMSEMIVWGGQDDFVITLNTGGRYNATTDAWTDTSTFGAPIGGSNGTGIWTGSEMIVWGGFDELGLADLGTGGRYCASTDTCASPRPGGEAQITILTQPGGELLLWTPLAAGDAYDLVRGSLGLLASSGGSFTTSIQTCLSNDQDGNNFVDPALPAVGSGFFYLVRATSCGGVGTYDSVGGLQVGSRDAEINASLNSCP